MKKKPISNYGYPQRVSAPNIRISTRHTENAYKHSNQLSQNYKTHTLSRDFNESFHPVPIKRVE